MSKVLITADLHFGVPQRLADILWSCRVMREYAKLADIDVVLVLGDLFHDRRFLEIDVLAKVCQFFEETAEQYKQQWICFPGNHDMFLRHSWELSSLVALRHHLTIIDDVKLLLIDDRRFFVLPFITYEKSYMRVLRRLEKHYQNGDILLTHIGVRGATLNTCFLLKDWSVVNFEQSKFHRIYAGHFHSKQQIGQGTGTNVWYPGSPIPFKFDEGDIPHGFYVYDPEADSHKFINIWKAGERFFPKEVPPPQFYTLLDELLPQKTAQDVQNGVVRVLLQRDYTMEQKREMKDRLLTLGVRSVRWMHLTQKLDTVVEAEKTNIPHRDLFTSWVKLDTKGTEGLDLALLNRANDDVVRDGDELYATEEVDAT